jgi:hypothetical protein
MLIALRSHLRLLVEPLTLIVLIFWISSLGLWPVILLMLHTDLPHFGKSISLCMSYEIFIKHFHLLRFRKEKIWIYEERVFWKTKLYQGAFTFCVLYEGYGSCVNVISFTLIRKTDPSLNQCLRKWQYLSALRADTLCGIWLKLWNKFENNFLNALKWRMDFTTPIFTKLKSQ